MTVLAAERIKLLSTRSTWWCSALAVALTAVIVGIYGVVVSTYRTLGIVDVAYMAELGATKLAVMLVMTAAVIAVTGEYRHSLIKATFLATPHRTVAMLAKSAVVVALSVVVGLLVSFVTWGVLALQAPGPATAPTADVWRVLVGSGLVYALAAVFAVAAGILLRHTAGAVVLVVLWPLIGEGLFLLVPQVGSTIYEWMPFVNLDRFLAFGVTSGTSDVWADVTAPIGPWGPLLYGAAVIGVLLAGAMVVVNKRDA